MLQRPCRKKTLSTDVHRGSAGIYQAFPGIHPRPHKRCGKKKKNKKKHFLFWCVSEWTLWEKAMWAEQNPKASESKAEKARQKGIWLISLPWESRVRDCQFVFKLAAPIAQSRMLAGQFPRHLFCPSLHLYEKVQWNFQNCQGILSQSEVWREIAGSGSGISLRSLGRSHPSLLTQDRAGVLNLAEPLCSLLLPGEDWAMALLRLF